MEIITDHSYAPGYVTESFNDLKLENSMRVKPVFKVVRSDLEVNKSLLKNEVIKKKKKFLESKDKSMNNKKNSGRESLRKLGRRAGNFKTGRWSKEEHQKFIEALLKFGNHWKKVQDHIESRNSSQARSHAQKFFVKIGKTKIQKLELDFQNNSLRSLSLLINNLEGDTVADSLRSLNERILSKKNKNKCFKKFDDNSSTEFDSVNIKVVNEG